MKIWSRLADSTKKKYRAEGVSPQRYNAWAKTKQSTKERLSKQGVSRDEFLKAPSTRDAKRTAAQQKAEKRLKEILPRARPASIRRGVEAMTGGELYIAATANVDTIRRLASKPAYREHEGKVINPFWYR